MKIEKVDTCPACNAPRTPPLGEEFEAGIIVGIVVSTETPKPGRALCGPHQRLVTFAAALKAIR